MGGFISRGTAHILLPCGDRLQEGKKGKKGKKGEKEVGFSFSAKKVFFGKVGLAARMKGRKTRSLERGKMDEKQRRRDRKEGGFSEGTFRTHRGKVEEEIHPGEGNWKREADFASLEKF